MKSEIFVRPYYVTILLLIKNTSTRRTTIVSSLPSHCRQFNSDNRSKQSLTQSTVPLIQPISHDQYFSRPIIATKKNMPHNQPRILPTTTEQHNHTRCRDRGRKIHTRSSPLATAALRHNDPPESRSHLYTHARESPSVHDQRRNR